MRPVSSIHGHRNRLESPTGIVRATKMSKDHLIFLHLSDIHFKRSEHGEVYDLDADLRRELIRDAQSVCNQVGRPDGILVTGDIAFSGKKHEFDQALAWLEELCNSLECDISEVWCVPGNHDVDRDIITQHRVLRDVRRTLRTCELREIDGLIYDYLHDPNVFYAPIEQYNGFAVQLGCHVTKDRPVWDHSFELNNGLVLRVHGLNSVLIFDHPDGLDGPKLVLGRYQASIKQENGVHNLVMCHHPPAWVRDGEQTECILNARAKIQLYGHEHEDQVTSGGSSLRICAGAVHPKRGENWHPRYNWITVSARTLGEPSGLHVKVFSRAWNEGTQKFDAVCLDGDERPLCPCGFDIGISVVPVSPAKEAQAEHVVDVANCDEQEELSGTTTEGGHHLNSSRVLAQRYHNLDYVQHMQIADRMGIHENDDVNFHGVELRLKHLERIKERGELEKLWTIVEELHGDKKHLENPFASTKEKGANIES